MCNKQSRNSARCEGKRQERDRQIAPYTGLMAIVTDYIIL